MNVMVNSAEIRGINKALMSPTRRAAIQEYAKGLARKRKISKGVKSRRAIAKRLNRPVRGFEDVELLSGRRKEFVKKIAPFLADNPQYFLASLMPVPGIYMSTAAGTKLLRDKSLRRLKRKRKELVKKIIYNRKRDGV
mgnify:CR=1 FL=1